MQDPRNGTHENGGFFWSSYRASSDASRLVGITGSPCSLALPTQGSGFGFTRHYGNFSSRLPIENLQHMRKSRRTMSERSNILYTNSVERLVKGLDRRISGVRFRHDGLEMEDVQKIAKALAGNESVVLFESINTGLGAAGLTALSFGLIGHATLTTLSLERNNLGASGANIIAKLLAGNSRITKLDLEKNKIGDKGAVAIFEALRHNNALTSLNLWNNGIGAGAANALGSALNENTSLRRLFLPYNFLHDDGAEQIANGLSNNEALAVLDLENNAIGVEGATALAVALRTNATLTHLNLWNNFLTEAGARALAGVLEDNKTLLKLEFLMPTEAMIQYVKGATARNREIRKEAFREAQEDDVTCSWGRSKLMVVGEGQAGKTATVRSLINLKFEPEWKSTVGIDTTEVKSSNTRAWEINKNEDFLLAFVGRAAVERSDRVTAKQRDILDVEEIVPNASTNEFGSYEEERSVNGECPGASQTLEGLVTYDESLVLQEEQGRDSLRMSVYDYGGQTVFHTMHSLFLTKHGVYVLVFSMVALLDAFMNAKQAVKFWLSSVHLHAPKAPIVLVGTFLDQLTKDKGHIEDVESGLASCLDRSCNIAKNDKLSFFPLDNSTGKGIVELRLAISTAAHGQEFVHRKVSIRWVRTLEDVVATNECWISRTSFVALSRKNQVNAAEEVANMLGFFHELGVLLYFDFTQSLQELVTMKPKWLFSAISKVVRHSSIHRLDKEFVESNNIQEDITRAETSALVSRDLLEILWEGKQVEFLLDLMRSLLLLSTWNFATSDELFLVPSLLEQRAENQEVEKERYTCLLNFDFLPDGIFERMVCLWVDYSSSKSTSMEPSLKNGYAKIYLSQGSEVWIRKSVATIEINVKLERDAFQCLRQTMAMMQLLQRTLFGGNLAVTVQVSSDGGMVSYSEAQRRELSPWLSRPVEESNQNIDEKLLEAFVSEH